MYRSSNIFESRRCFILNSRSSYLINALYDAVVDGDLSTVNYLLVTKKVDPNYVLEDYDAAPLHTATGIGTEQLAVKLVETLLENSANPDIKTSDGTTPLMIACMWGRSLVSNILLKYGADPWMEDSEGKNSIDFAFDNGYYQMYNALKESKFNLSISSDNTVADYYGSRKWYYTIAKPDDPALTLKVGNKISFEEAAVYSDINSETNCMEFYSLNTGFLRPSCKRDSISSTGTFMSIPRKNEELPGNICNITICNGGASESFDDCLNVFPQNNNIYAINEHQTSLKSENDSSSVSLVSSNSYGSGISYGTDRIKEELKKNNIKFGPITKTTKKVYQNLVKKVIRGKRKNSFQNDQFSVFPEVLQSTFKDNYMVSINKWSNLEFLMSKNFANENRLWRGGRGKEFFTYLLLDPFITNDLPSRKHNMSDVDIWKTFILSIFYIGKGKNSRPFSHLFEALKCNIKRTVSKKVLKIQKIWANSAGIICLHLFHNIISAEAHSREASMIDAIGLSNLTNIQSGEYYGIVKNWSIKQKQQLGVVLLNKALQIYLAEGERQIFPADLK